MKKIYAAMLVLPLILFGCIDESDWISIHKDGTTEFKSEITVTNPKAEKAECEKAAEGAARALSRAGWTVQWHWTSDVKPLAMEFSGNGNLHTVKTLNSLYRITATAGGPFAIAFVPAQTSSGASSRHIVFNKPSVDGATVLDASGQEVKEVKNVLSTTEYTVKFE